MLTDPPIDRTFVCGHEIWIDEDGLLHTRMVEELHVTLQDAEDHLAAGHQLTGGKKYPTLIDIRKAKSIDQDARAYYASTHTARLETAAAILIDSPIGRIIGNFFIGLNRSTVPTRLFNSEEQAIEWLKEFLE